MMRMKTVVFSLLLGNACPALAADMMALKADTQVSGDVVRLGDLVTGAGAQAGLPLFRAPEIGKIGAIRAESIRAAAAELGLASIDLNGIRAVTVTRTAAAFPPDRLIDLLRARLILLDASLTDSVVEFDTPPPRLSARSEADIALSIPLFEVESGRFRADVVDLAGEKHQVAGVVQSRLVVPVLIRSVGRGDVVTPADYVLEPRARRSLPTGTVSDPLRLASVVARRGLKPGIIRKEDVAERDLVERNQKVNVVYTRPGLNLTMAGKALVSGPAGAVVQVQNLASKRSFDAVVTGPGTVSAKLY